MRMKIRGEHLEGLKSLCVIDKVESLYLEVCGKVESLSWSTRFKMYNPLHLPPSFRMFDYREYDLVGEDKTKAKRLRRIYHDIWWFENHVIKNIRVPSNISITLDSYGTECVLRLAEYYKYKGLGDEK